MKTLDFQGKQIQIDCYISVDEYNSIDAGEQCEDLENSMAAVVAFFGIIPCIGDAFPTDFGSGYAIVKERNFATTPGRIMYTLKYA